MRFETGPVQERLIEDTGAFVMRRKELVDVLSSGRDGWENWKDLSWEIELVRNEESNDIYDAVENSAHQEELN